MRRAAARAHRGRLRSGRPANLAARRPPWRKPFHARPLAGDGTAAFSGGDDLARIMVTLRGMGRHRSGLDCAGAAAIAVALVLAGAAASRADVCPRRFDELTIGLPEACVFVGAYNPRCGGAAVALFAGDGNALVVSLAFPPATPATFFAGRVLSATEGTLLAWRGDRPLALAPRLGQVRLEDHGARLTVRFDADAGRIGRCPLREYVGHFVGMAAAPGLDAGPRPPALAGQRMASR